MENNEIVYTTVDEQIEKLKKQHLIIQDEDFAKSQLKLYGYFNLIKNYREPYIVNIDNKKVYRSGVTFEQICSLYILDKNLRNAVMASMLDLEEHVKAITADIIGNSFGIHQDQYLQFKNYRDKKRRKSRFSLSGILQKMRDAMDTDKNPFIITANVTVLFRHGFYLKIYISVQLSTILVFLRQENRSLSLLLCIIRTPLICL